MRQDPDAQSSETERAVRAILIMSGRQEVWGCERKLWFNTIGSGEIKASKALSKARHLAPRTLPLFGVRPSCLVHWQ